MHPRNRHTGRYDFTGLVKLKPALARYTQPNRAGEPTINFSDPAAVRTLNAALLRQFYGIENWDIPPGYLCPPIPGRADYLHYVADLLASENDDVVPRGPEVHVLDIGVGASCIYPVIGHCEYGWTFIGTDIDPDAIASASKIVASNSELAGGIEIRRQKSPNEILRGVVQPGEFFNLVVCNPPFHSSLADARAGSERKAKNLRLEKPVLNFGGQNNELWCPGGEVEFVRQMIRESAEMKDKFRWLSALISKETNLPAIYAALEKYGASESRTFEMMLGQKKTRIVAWTF